MTTATRSAILRSKILEIVNAAENLGLIENPLSFRNSLIIKIKGSQGCTGGIRNGRPIVTMSTHDHYFDTVNYNKTLIGTRYKRSNWNRAAAYAAQGITYFPEYASFDRDPTIGGFIVTDNLHPVISVVAHEIAHALVYWNRRQKNLPLKTKPHGDEWRNVYRRIREVVLNPLLRSPEALPVAASTKTAAPTSIKRPKAGTKRAIVWDLADTYKAWTKEEVIKEAIRRGVNSSVARKMYAAWEASK